MPSCPFVQQGKVRLLLVDSYRRTHAALIKAHEVLLAATGEKKATREALDASHLAIDAAFERIAKAEADADYIDVKQELTAGEQRHIFSGIVREMNLGEKTALDPNQIGKTKLVEYILGWSFVDFDGRPEAVTESAIDNLSQDTYRVLIESVDFHETATSEAREKKVSIATTS